MSGPTPYQSLQDFLNDTYVPYEVSLERKSRNNTTINMMGIERMRRLEPYLLLRFVFGIYPRTRDPVYAEEWGVDTPERTIRMFRKTRRMEVRPHGRTMISNRTRPGEDERCKVVAIVHNDRGDLGRNYIVNSQRVVGVSYRVDLHSNDCTCPHKTEIPRNDLCKHVMLVAYHWIKKGMSLPSSLVSSMGCDLKMSRTLGDLCNRYGYPLRDKLLYRRRSAALLSNALGPNHNFYLGPRIDNRAFVDHFHGIWVMTNFYGLGFNQQAITIANKGRPLIKKTLDTRDFKSWNVPVLETPVLGWDSKRFRLYKKGRFRLEYRYHRVELLHDSFRCTCIYSSRLDLMCCHIRAIVWLDMLEGDPERPLYRGDVIREALNHRPIASEESSLDSFENMEDGLQGSTRAVFEGTWETGITIPVMERDPEFLGFGVQFRVEVSYQISPRVDSSASSEGERRDETEKRNDTPEEGEGEGEGEENEEGEGEGEGEGEKEKQEKNDKNATRRRIVEEDDVVYYISSFDW